jgi:predicted Abi (CAAX) family protease
VPLSGVALGTLWLRRLGLAGRLLPSRRQWLEVFLLVAALTAAAGPLALQSGLIGTTFTLTPAAILLLAPRVLIAPALFEETLFRVVLNPHPKEVSSGGARWGSALASLGGYVLVHPLVGLVLPSVRPVFGSPAFLAITFLLGATCLAAYLRTGSIWPPVVIHWLTVILWLSLGGSGVLPVRTG